MPKAFTIDDMEEGGWGAGGGRVIFLKLSNGVYP